MSTYNVPHPFHNNGSMNTEYNARSIEYDAPEPSPSSSPSSSPSPSAAPATTPTRAVVEEKKKGLSMPMMALILLLVLALVFFLYNQNTFGGRGGFIRNAFSMFGKP